MSIILVTISPPQSSRDINPLSSNPRFITFPKTTPTCSSSAGLSSRPEKTEESSRVRERPEKAEPAPERPPEPSKPEMSDSFRGQSNVVEEENLSSLH